MLAPPAMAQSDVTGPRPLEARLNMGGDYIEVNFDEEVYANPLDRFRALPVELFELRVDGAIATITEARRGPRNIRLVEFEPIIKRGQTVTLSYTAPTDPTADQLRDEHDNPAATFNDFPVRNGSTVEPTPAQAPTHVTAQGLSETSIGLRWTAPKDNGGSRITGYRIERSPNGMSPWRTIQPDAPSTATSYTDTELTAGTLYHYRIRAVTAVGPGEASTTATATTYSLTVLPSKTQTDTDEPLEAVTLDEAGVNQDWYIRLGSPPPAGESVDVTVRGIPAMWRTNTSHIVFDRSNWNTPQRFGTGTCQRH